MLLSAKKKREMFHFYISNSLRIRCGIPPIVLHALNGHGLISLIQANEEKGIVMVSIVQPIL